VRLRWKSAVSPPRQKRYGEASCAATSPEPLAKAE